MGNVRRISHELYFIGPASLVMGIKVPGTNFPWVSLPRFYNTECVFEEYIDIY